MTDTMSGNDGLERALGELSVWGGGEEGVWRRALDRERGAGRRAWYLRGRAWGVGAAAVLVLAAGLAVFRNMGSVRSGSEGAPVGLRAVPDAARAWRVEALKEVDQGFVDSDRAVEKAAARVPRAEAAQPSATAAAQSSGRFVVRRATMELETRDVHAVFAKVAMVVQPALGEYVEASSIAGEGKEARAELTLRVTAEHLSGVLNELRGYAAVASEQSGGQDITDQVVDIEARLRNEQRIEQELLALLTTKKDASLEDILRVQQELSRVREQIERMQAQRDSLGRMASLATVLVIVRYEGGPLQPAPNGFEEALSRAWRRGVDDLGGLVGGCVRLVIGGLPVWVVLGGAGVLGWRAWKRRRAAGADEPAPGLTP